jgi:formylmethanofuran dehydrogenase subunit E
MIPEIPEYEQLRRVNEMKADPHIRETLHQVDDLLEEHPEVTIYFQISCSNCNYRLTDTDNLSLGYSYICDSCNQETKTSNGDLGYLSVFTPPGMEEVMKL